MLGLPGSVGDDYAIDENGCWVWQKARCNGYPHKSWRGKSRRAHRLYYELLVGPIPDGLTIDHLCRNKACVNPDHMEPVTIGENVARGPAVSTINRAKTCCDYGHPFDTDNTRIRRNGSRSCKTCSRRRVREHARKRRARERTARSRST